MIKITVIKAIQHEEPAIPIIVCVKLSAKNCQKNSHKVKRIIAT